ncbi:MAG TPA: type II secretion system F family protein [Syntrophales bacterium]|nr:type II secretion system F family protein [Syntrophales bacterium]HQN79367.1 type II secretion system F family protein [Syntrophales bacterium]HQQ28590.1 type II secretion system F family protein [Syntrophales bacterium]
MAVYLWEGTTRRGELQKGELEAENDSALRIVLRRQGLTNVKIKQKPKDLLEYIPFLRQRVKEKDVVVFSRQFATMINAGLPIIQCLDLLSAEEQNRTFSRIIASVKTDIEQGHSLTDSLKKHPAVFDELFVNLVAAGEAGGILDVILNRLSSYLEKAMKLKSKVKGAMVYPASVLTISIAVVILLLYKVVPVFDELFRSMGSALPGPTQFLVDASRFVQGNILYLFVALIAGGFAFQRYYRTNRGRYRVDKLLLKLPIFGILFKKVAVAKFSRTLSTLLGSGVPILEGLEIVSRTAGNRVVENALLETRKSISEGKTIAEPLLKSKIFPSMVVQMIGVGESTGALDAMLAKIADFYDQEVDAAVDAMTSLLEPVMMVFLGGIVGGMIVALYLPIFSMAGAIGG